LALAHASAPLVSEGISNCSVYDTIVFSPKSAAGQVNLTAVSFSVAWVNTASVEEAANPFAGKFPCLI